MFIVTVVIASMMLATVNFDLDHFHFATTMMPIAAAMMFFFNFDHFNFTATMTATTFVTTRIAS
jgi:hypothetical protein